MGKFDNLTAQCGKFDGLFFQFIEQSHCFFLGKTAFEFLYRLVVIVANSPVLRMESG